MHDSKRRKQAFWLLFCAAMVILQIPAADAAKAEPGARPVLMDQKVIVNGAQAAQIGAVTYARYGDDYVLNPSLANAHVRNGDVVSFAGTIMAPEGETISWIRVDVYDAATLEPYTEGAEYYRLDNMRVTQYDLANIPPMTIGETFESEEYALVEKGKYIVMFSAGASNGNGFADMDANMEEGQGPAVLLEVKLSPENCSHPHSDYVYIRHASGETRKHSYGDVLSHHVEPLFERYCGLCDLFLMNIWGAGVAEEHIMDVNGVCMECGYYHIDADIFADETAEDAADALKRLYEEAVAVSHPNRSVNIRTSWENERLAVGDTLTLSAVLSGYEGLNHTIFWQCDRGDGFENIDIADGHPNIQFVVDEENKLWRWRAGVRIDVEIPDAQEVNLIAQDTDVPTGADTQMMSIAEAEKRPSPAEDWQ